MLQRSQHHWTLSLLIQSENCTFWQPDESPPYHSGGVCAFLVPGVILGAPVRLSHAKLVPGDTKGPSVLDSSFLSHRDMVISVSVTQKPHPFLFLKGNQSEDSWFKVKAVTACLSGACVAAQYKIKAGLKSESCKEWKYGGGNRQDGPHTSHYQASNASHQFSHMWHVT